MESRVSRRYCVALYTGITTLTAGVSYFEQLSEVLIVICTGGSLPPRSRYESAGNVLRPNLVLILLPRLLREVLNESRSLNGRPSSACRQVAYRTPTT